MHVHPEISEKLASWIRAQRMFFVGSAPLSAQGHVNISPKGGDAFRVLGPLDVAYEDYTGSGAETVAHLRENERIVILFCAFEGAAQIVRLHGRGKALLPGTPEHAELAPHFPSAPGARAIIRVAVERVSDSCGYSVPFYDYRDDRVTLRKWAQKKGADGLEEYRAEKNQTSIDGLPAFDLGQSGAAPT
jgi:hypothetical protein